MINGFPFFLAVLASQVKNKLPILEKSVEQTTKSIQKTLGKRATSSRSSSLEDIPRANRNCNIAEGTDLGGGKLMTGEKMGPENDMVDDILPQIDANLKATEKLDAIISNMMQGPLLNTNGTPEEQILQRQQILEELQKVERELQEKAKEQVHRTAQHRAELQQYQMLAVQQEGQQVYNQYDPKPLHKALQKQLEEAGQARENDELSSLPTCEDLRENEILLNKVVNPGELEEQLVDLLSGGVGGDTMLPPTPPPSAVDSQLANTNQSNLDQNLAGQDEFKVLNTNQGLGSPIPEADKMLGNGGVVSVQPPGNVGQSQEPLSLPQLANSCKYHFLC